MACGSCGRTNPTTNLIAFAPLRCAQKLARVDDRSRGRGGRIALAPLGSISPRARSTTGRQPASRVLRWRSGPSGDCLWPTVREVLTDRPEDGPSLNWTERLRPLRCRGAPWKRYRRPSGPVVGCRRGSTRSPSPSSSPPVASSATRPRSSPKRSTTALRSPRSRRRPRPRRRCAVLDPPGAPHPTSGRDSRRTRQDALYGPFRSRTARDIALARESPPAGPRGAIAPAADTWGMAHYHVWVRRGQIFTMRPRLFESRHTATKAARRLRSDAPDRLVLACEACPQPQRSRRRPPAWGRIARDVAAAVGLQAGDVRQALATARAADRERRRAVESSRTTGPATSSP